MASSMKTEEVKPEPPSDADAATSTAPSQPAQPAQPNPAAGPSSSSPAPSSTSSTTRPPYVTQFSAATQMILNRMGKPGSLSSALSSASSVARTIEKSTFEDAKRRLVMNMNTSLTMPMPTPTPPPPGRSAPRSSTLPMNDAFQLRTPAPVKTLPGSGKGAGLKAPAHKAKVKAPRGTKRKRGKDGEDETSSLSELSGSEGGVASKDQAVLTMTKSGRHVQKPTQYNPSQSSGSQKRKTHGKRTQEQALCKVCTRGLSLATNQIVFCDGCNSCWHQLCHDPYIDDDFLGSESPSWFCSGCRAKREKHLAKKRTLGGFKGVSWANKSAEQKRSYLSSVPHGQLVNIVMYSTELHPDLPIFPTHEPGPSTKRNAQGLLASGTANGISVRTDAPLSGPIHYSQGSSAKTAAEAHNQADRESSVESVPPAWPKVGRGCLAGLEMNEGDLQDKNDYEAFSVTTYDSKGNKVIENGVQV
ncbi:hypothetical protein F4779DRAFT_21403 [Xylariaceae sp. FL0662B]|nr:hypothetical protein F4779DRAFT_21403 [Xylariaceae sp. FL0662B]